MKNSQSGSQQFRGKVRTKSNQNVASVSPASRANDKSPV